MEFWWPLKIIPEFYSDEGFAAYSDYHTGTRPFPPWSIPFFQHIEHKGGNLLDVGCGDGAFLERAAESGYAPHGIDLDANSIKVARELRGLTNVECSTLQTYADKMNARFSTVTFFEVLEHQDDPAGFLGTIGNLLDNDGIICGSVPNRNRFLSSVDRRLDEGDLPPHHFLWFSTKSLSGILERAGYKTILILPSGNIPFSELNNKLSRLILSILRLRGTSLIRLASLFSLPVTALLWTGYRIWPAHIFFAARKFKQP